MNTHSDIVLTLGRPDLAKRLGLSYNTVQGWYRRNSIPWHRWRDVSSAASALGHPEITFAVLHSTAYAPRDEAA